MQCTTPTDIYHRRLLVFSDLRPNGNVQIEFDKALRRAGADPTFIDIDSNRRLDNCDGVICIIDVRHGRSQYVKAEAKKLRKGFVLASRHLADLPESLKRGTLRLAYPDLLLAKEIEPAALPKRLSNGSSVPFLPMPMLTASTTEPEPETPRPSVEITAPSPANSVVPGPVVASTVPDPDPVAPDPKSEDSLKTFGEVLRVCRNARGMQQWELGHDVPRSPEALAARKTHNRSKKETGVGQARISKWERGGAMGHWHHEYLCTEVFPDDLRLLNAPSPPFLSDNGRPENATSSTAEALVVAAEVEPVQVVQAQPISPAVDKDAPGAVFDELRVALEDAGFGGAFALLVEEGRVELRVGEKVWSLTTVAALVDLVMTEVNDTLKRELARLTKAEARTSLMLTRGPVRRKRR